MQSLSSVVDFTLVLNQKTSKTALDHVLKYINSYGAGESDKQQAKRKAHEFLTKMHNYLRDQASTENSKFYTLLILKFVTEKEERTILSVLTTHPLYKYLASLARETDPFLPVDEKGKNLFRDKKIGREFMRFILQSMKVWGEKFASNKKNQESHFKRTYDDLLQKGVVMPNELAFYSKSILSNRKSVSEIRSKQDTANTPSSSTKKQQGVKIGNDTEPESMKTMQEDIERIDKFVRLLEGNGNQQKYCHDYHKMFQKQSEKYEALINKLIASSDEQGLDTALAINQFYTQQSAAYRDFLFDKKDLFSYVNLIQIKADELHQTLSKTPQSKQTRKQYMKKQVKITGVDSRKNNLIQQGDNSQNKQLVSQLITKLNEKSTSMTKSFKQIKDSLSKQKGSTTRLKRSISGMRKSGVSRFGKSITKSRIAPLFSNPPNLYPQPKRYQGQLIQPNHLFSHLMHNLTKNQGIRRFVTSNFKSKNPLFQNTHVQIGFKSQPIYEQVPDYQVILSIELFIGNKTESEIDGLSLEYKGDSSSNADNMLLYATPKTINTYLQSGYQIKHQLLVIPLGNHLAFVHFNLKYSYQGEEYSQKIVLPNSILKFTDNSKITKREFVQSWNASTIFRTQQFKLTRYIAPDCLSKYISGLSQLSSYDQFLAPDSETDYELGCEVVLMRKYEGVLRISVRPNLNAVLQIGITDQSKQAHQGFVNYLQTLQMLLTHVDHQS